MMFHFKTAIVAITTKDKQWSTKSYTEKLKIQQHNPTKNRFLLHLCRTVKWKSPLLEEQRLCNKKPRNDQPICDDR
jgi:hypothetical protein